MFRIIPLMMVVFALMHGSRSLAESRAPLPVPLPAAKPGMTIDSKKSVSDGWQLVLLAKPRVAKGDVESASAKVRRYASMFNMVLIAKTSRDPNGEFKLDDLRVGNCVRRKGRWIVVSVDSHAEHGVQLDFFAKQVLTRSESNLRKANVIAMGDSFRVFDADAVVRHNSAHQRMKIRHIVWVNKKSGNLATMQWLLRRTSSGPLEMVEDVVHALPPKFIEDRVFSVEADEFTFGIPSELALAIDKLPDGKKVPVNSAFRTLASEAFYTEDSQSRLVSELNDAIRQSRRKP